MSEPRIKIYSGLSLTEDEVKARLPHAEFAGPIRRGDLREDFARGIHIVGIIDGEFHQEMAVAPSEILTALRRGVRVYGSSSMGAMRAAELASEGMIGVGRVFETILKSRSFRDDYLGQVFFEGEGALTSLPMIDFSLALDEISDRVRPAHVKKLKKQYEELHFSERNLNHLEYLITQTSGAEKPMLLKIVSLLKKKSHFAKKQDGMTLLRRIQEDLNLTKKVYSRHADF